MSVPDVSVQAVLSSDLVTLYDIPANVLETGSGEGSGSVIAGTKRRRSRDRNSLAGKAAATSSAVGKHPEQE